VDVERKRTGGERERVVWGGDGVGWVGEESRFFVGEEETQVAGTDELAVVVEGGSEGGGWTVVEEGGGLEGAMEGKGFSGGEVVWGVSGEGGRGMGEGRGENGGEVGEAGVDIFEGSGGRGGAVGGEGGPVVAGGQVLEQSIAGLRRRRGDVWAEQGKGEGAEGALLVSGVGGADVAGGGAGAEVEDGGVEDGGFLGSCEEDAEGGGLGVGGKDTVE